MDDNVSISIQKGFGNDSTSEEFTLQLLYIKTTFEITFTCVIFTIAFFGCLGNVATIGKIVYDPKYHTPTFAAIGQLAFADLLSVTLFTVALMTNIYKFWQNVKGIRIISTMSSFLHLCLLSAVRYLITVHPVQSRQHLTVTAVCLCSLTIWIFSGVAGVILIYVVQTLSLTNSMIIHLLAIIISVLTVSSIMILLHVKKNKSITEFFV